MFLTAYNLKLNTLINFKISMFLLVYYILLIRKSIYYVSEKLTNYNVIYYVCEMFVNYL